MPALLSPEELTEQAKQIATATKAYQDAHPQPINSGRPVLTPATPPLAVGRG